VVKWIAVLGYNRWLKFGGFVLRMLLTTLCVLYIAFVVAYAIGSIFFGGVPISYNGEPPWDGGLGP
jgi:hypothetical protein